MRYGKLVLLFFALSSVGLARIGDTLEECKARYGEVISTDTHPPYQFSPIRDERPWFTFEAEVEGAPVRIQAVFENGRLVEIGYYPHSGQKLTPEYAMAILETYGERKHWQMGFMPEIGESPLGYLGDGRYLNNKKDKLYATAGIPEDDWQGLSITCVEHLRRHGQWDDSKNAPRDLGEIILGRIDMEHKEGRAFRAFMKERIDKAWADLEAKYGEMGRRP